MPATGERYNNPQQGPSHVDSFKHQLALWFGGLTLVLLLAGGLYAAQVASTLAAQQRGETLSAAAGAGAELLGAHLRERELDIMVLAQSPLLRDGALDSRAVLSTLQARSALRREIAWLGVADATGQVLQAANGLLVGRNVAQRDWFKAGIEGVFVGDVHEAVLLAKLLPQATGGEPLRFVDFAAPIRDTEGRLRGVVGAHAHWSWVRETLEEAVLRRLPDVDVLIVNRKGEVLYPEQLIGKAGLDGGLPSTQRAELRTWPDGERYLTSQAPVRARSSNELGWQVVVRQPAAVAQAPVRALQWRMALIGLLAGLVTAGLAWHLAGRVSRPVQALAEVARRIEHGDGDVRFPEPEGASELRQLLGSVRAMTDGLLRKEDELAHANATLEEQVRQRTEALEQANVELARLATRDALTGAYNRRWFDDKLAECFHLAQRAGQGFALLLVDVDHFKRINDNHGHDIGDAVLQQLAALLQAHTRASDCVARFGGEEFAVLMPGTAEAVAALAVAEKLRAAVAAERFPGVGSLTLSGGVSLWAIGDDGGASVVKRADLALYRAKADGRNRIELLLAESA